MRRELKIQLIKLAELGGDGKDTEFERSFSNIAHSYLKDKAPSLSPYEIGFQMLNRNQEGDQAQGIMSFKVGNQLLSVPLFFQNGQLKGHEALYLHDTDQLVPFKENWVNDILNKRPRSIGRSVDRGLLSKEISNPNLDQFRFPPKYASMVADGMAPGVAAMASFMTNDPPAPLQNTLRSFLVQGGTPMVQKLASLLMGQPELAEVLASKFNVLEDMKYAHKILSEGILKESASSCFTMGASGKKKKYVPVAHRNQNSESGLLSMTPETPEPPAHVEPKVAALEIITDFNPDGDYTAREREFWMRDGVIFRDKRAEEDVTNAYRVEETLKLKSPSESGIYSVLMRGGSFKKCLILNGMLKCHPSQCLVVDLDTKNWTVLKSEKIFIDESKYLADGYKYDEWLKSLPEATSLEGRGAIYVLIDGNRKTTPFRIEKSIGGRTYSVYSRGYGYHNPRGYDDWDDDMDEVQFTDYQGALKFLGGTAMVPKGTKLLTLRAAEPERDDGDGDENPYYSLYPEEDPPVGSPVDLNRAIFSLPSVKVASLGGEVQIDEKSMSPLSALIYLVKEAGLRVSDAKTMIKEADRKQVVRFILDKKADASLNYSGGAPAFPSDPQMGAYGNSNIPMQVPMMQEQAVQMPNLYQPQDPTSALDPQTLSTIQNAVQTGQKDVVDSAMIGSLLKTQSPDKLFDDNIPDMMKGLNRQGHLLLGLYAHPDKYKDRFGDRDLPEFEENLRQAFDQNGDLILFLKKKTIDPNPHEMSSDLQSVN